MANAAHSTLVGTDLHLPGYYQSGSPGVTPAGTLWIDTTTPGSPVVKVSNGSTYDTVSGGAGTADGNPGVLWKTGATLYYGPHTTWASSSTTDTVQIMTLQRLYASAFYVPNAVTADRIAVDVTTVGAGTCNVRLGIYTMGSDGRPGTLLIDGGTFDGVGAGTGIQALTISQALAAGTWYWAVHVAAGSSTAPTLRVSALPPVIPFGGTTLSGLTRGTTVYKTHTSTANVPDALPGSFGTPTGTDPATKLWHVGVRVS